MKKLTRNINGCYEIDGQFYPSVTTITKVLEKEGLHNWIAQTAVDYYENTIVGAVLEGINLEAIKKEAVNAHKTEARDAADFGSLVHNAIDLYHKTQAWPIEPTVKEKFEQAIEWEQSVKLAVANSEITVHSLTHRYAGTLDLECFADLGDGEKHGLMDWKNSSGFYPEWKYQIAAYVGAWEEMNPGKYLDFGGIGVIDKKLGKFKPYIFQRAELIIPYQMFLCLCQFNHLKDWGKK